MNEATLQKKYEARAARYEKEYADYIEEAAEVRKELYNQEWTPFDSVAFGEYAQTWEEFIPALEDDSTSRDALGEIPRLGVGLVALQYATLPITAFASVQPLADEAGIVHYREVVATSTRGNTTAGDTLVNPEGAGNIDYTYYDEDTQTTQAVTDAGGGTPQTNYTINLSAPVRLRSIEITLNNFKAVDDGEGNILGRGLDGTVDYNTGALTLRITDTTGVNIGDIITITYQQNIIEHDDIPGFVWRLSSSVVRASLMALQTSYTTFAEIAIRRRFGRILSDDIAADAVSQINGAVLTKAFTLMRAASLAKQTTWDAAVPTGVSTIDHRQTFLDAVEEAASMIGSDTGRGSVSFYVASTQGRIVLRSLGFTPSAKSVAGPYLAGYFEGTPVFFAPTSIVPEDEVIVGYRGPMWFESPVVYAPHIPMTTIVGQAGNNVFKKLVGTAHSAALKVVCPRFTANIKIINM